MIALCKGNVLNNTIRYIIKNVKIWLKVGNRTVELIYRYFIAQLLLLLMIQMLK